MGYKSYFHDDCVYSAEDVNIALSQFVTSGIEDPFEDGVPYNATKLNDITYAVSSAGVIPSTNTSCKCSVDSEKNTVHIAAGTAFFSDGKRITFDTDGETLAYETGVKNYVYLKSVPSENRCYPICGSEQPSGDTVMLAEISADGVLTDKRTYARGKLPGYQSNVDVLMKIDDTITLNQTVSGGRDYTAKEYIIHLGTNNYTTLLFVQDDTSYPAMAVYDIASERVFGFYKPYAVSGTRISVARDIMRVKTETPIGKGLTYTGVGYIGFKKNGTDIVLGISGESGSSARTATMVVPLKFIIF